MSREQGEKGKIDLIYPYIYLTGMRLMRIYIIRHADPDYTNDTLTPTGHEEARTLAQYLQTLNISEIYASPLGRTQDTAAYTARLLDLPVQTEPWARELESSWIQDLDQSFAGMAPSKKPVEESLVRAGPGFRLFQPDPCLMQANMEVIRQGSDDLLCRQGFVREGDSYRVLRPNRTAVAVFTHMGVGLVWLSHLLNIPLMMAWSGFFLHPASVTTVLMDERLPGFAFPRCTGLGDISHLCKAGISPRPVGIYANAD
jgi:broad specificity phosphatase PhoE